MKFCLLCFCCLVGLYQSLSAQTYTANTDVQYIDSYSSNFANVFANDSLSNVLLLDTLVVLSPPNHGVVISNGNDSYNFVPDLNFGNTVFVDSMLYMGIAVYEHPNPDSSYAVSDVAWVYFVANFDSLSCDMGCVYPGDIDNNGEVSAHDILPLGIAYSMTGPIREFVSSQWLPFPALDWQQQFLFGGPNFKYADCNGNGIVGMTDFGAILNNYGKTHNTPTTTFTPATLQQNLQIAVDIENDTVSIGDTIVASIRIGNMAENYNVYGFACNMFYNVDDGNTATVEFPESFVNTNTDEIISVYRKSKPTQLDLALTRIDHQIVNGNGIVARVRFVMEDIIEGGKDETTEAVLSLELKDVVVYANSEQVLSYNNISIQNDSITVALYTPSSFLPNVLLYPMPATDQIWVKSTNSMERVQLIDLHGRVLIDQKLTPTNLTAISLEQIPVGIYVVGVWSDERWTYRKIVK